MKKNVMEQFNDNLRITTWLGGKFRWAKEVNLMQDHTKSVYIEPFVGMANVLLNSYPHKNEIVNDKDYGTVCLIRECQRDFEELSKVFKELPIKKDIFDYFLDMKRAGYKGVNQQIVALAELFLTSYSFDANRTNMRFLDPKHDEARKKLYDRTCRMLDINAKRVQNRLQNVEITNIDALDVIEEFKDCSEAMIYVDSPYEYSTMGEQKDLYYEKFDSRDQENLLRLVRDAKASIMLSGYRGGIFLYDTYLTSEAWHVWQLDSKVNMACRTGVEHKGSSQEYLWTNYLPSELARSYMHSDDIALTEVEAKTIRESLVI
jgi:site-specific DNA-adenine methylase